jgi:hypothetical protein
MSCKCDTINIVNDNNVIVVSHADGRDGKSAYQQAVEGGYTGTEQEFNCSLSLLADVAEGKKQIVDAINTKGGNSTPDESFQQLAEDIKELPIRSLSDAGYTFADGYKPQTYGELIMNKYKLIEVDDPTITTIDAPNAFSANLTSLRRIRLSNLISIKNARNAIAANVEELDFPQLRTIIDSLYAINYTGETFLLPNLTYVNSAFVFASVIAKNLILPSSTSFYGSGTAFGLSNKNTIENIVFGRLTAITSLGNENIGTIRNITIGKDTDIHLPFFRWSATSVIAEGQSGIDELNENLYNNLLTKLYDHSNDGETRTLRIGWLAKVSQENIDYANSKGWTLTT